MHFSSKVGHNIGGFTSSSNPTPPHSRWNINWRQIFVAQCVGGGDSGGAWCHLHVIYNEGKQSGRLCVTPLHSDAQPLQSATAQYQHLLPSDSCGDLINCEWSSAHSDDSALPQSLCTSSFDRYACLVTLELDHRQRVQNKQTTENNDKGSPFEPFNTHNY